MSLKRATTANRIIKDTVFGFIRNHEKGESISAPEMIKYLILNYYLLKDVFDPVDKSSIFELDDDLRLAKFNASRGANGFVFGQLPINDGFEGIAEYRWTLEIVQASGLCEVVIGLGPRSKKCNPWPADFVAMVWWENVILNIKNNCETAGDPKKPVVKRLEQGDMIGMALERKQDVLHFHINGKQVTSIQRQRHPDGQDRQHYLTIYQKPEDYKSLNRVFYRLVDFSVVHCSTKSIAN